MNKAKSTDLSYSKLKDLGMLFKVRLTITVVLSAILAYMIALDGSVSFISIVVLSLGGFAVTASANTFNQILEKDYDCHMKRTEDRPLAAGRISVSYAILLAGFLALLGVGTLAYFNVWAAFFGCLSLVSYAFVYTPLKRISSIAIPVGAIPGAMPVLIGCVAAQGELTFLALVLFSIQFFWQFPISGRSAGWDLMIIKKLDSNLSLLMGRVKGILT